MFDFRKKLASFIPAEAAKASLQNVLTVEWAGHKTVLVEVPDFDTPRMDEVEMSGMSSGYGRLSDEDHDDQDRMHRNKPLLHPRPGLLSSRSSPNNIIKSLPPLPRSTTSAPPISSSSHKSSFASSPCAPTSTGSSMAASMGPSSGGNAGNTQSSNQFTPIRVSIRDHTTDHHKTASNPFFSSEETDYLDGNYGLPAQDAAGSPDHDDGSDWDSDFHHYQNNPKHGATSQHIGVLDTERLGGDPWNRSRSGVSEIRKNVFEEDGVDLPRGGSHSSRTQSSIGGESDNPFD